MANILADVTISAEDEDSLEFGCGIGGHGDVL